MLIQKNLHFIQLFVKLCTLGFLNEIHILSFQILIQTVQLQYAYSVYIVVPLMRYRFNLRFSEHCRTIVSLKKIIISITSHIRMI